MAAEQDLDPASPPSRAAQVLDQMLRAGALGDAEKAAPERTSTLPGSGRRSDLSWPGRHLRPRGGALAVLAIAATAAAGVLVFVVLDRPPPIEERLPLTAAARVDGAGDDTGAATGGGDDAGTSSNADALDADPATNDRTDGTGDENDGGAAGAAGGQVVVHVAGAVTAPGVVRLSSGSRVVDAVTAAGGLRQDADPDRVNLAATLVDGQRVVVPVVGQPLPAEVVPSPAPSSGGAAPGVASSTSPVDLNTATAEQLDALPGVGPSTAAAILEHRESSGPFASVDELLDVRGIGEAKLEALRDLVSVGG
jgi:competence protein ComEA